MTARLCALLIGVLGLAALRAQYDALPAPMSGKSLPQQLWFLAGYFTILTNLAATFALLAVARGWRMPARFAAGLVLSMAMVGIVYHTVLARLWSPQGLAWWADQGLHTAMPVAVALWWVAFADKRVNRADLGWWLAWPVAYCVYALMRGQVSGAYPYPFLEVPTLGWPMVALNIAGLVAAFAVLGLALVWLARRLPRTSI